jgi:uncharacterized SAM-binding protein YcdF (DUF218 family)
MLNNYVGIFYLALCAFLFVSHLLHLFRALLLLRRFVVPIQAPLRYLHTVRGAVNFFLVGVQGYLKVTPRHNHC